MVKIGTVWDSAVEALRGRAGMVTPVAVAAIFLPAVVQAGVQNFLVTPGVQPGVGVALLMMVVSIAVAVLALWAALAITAMLSHPDVTRAEAGRRATARLLPLIGVTVALTFALALAFIPLLVLMIASGVDMTQVSTPGYRPEMSGGAALALFLYFAVLTVGLLWLFARLMPLVPTVLHERLGLRAIGRAFRLTKGMGLKLVGVLILFAVVLLVAAGAAQLVFGLVFRLVLGADNIAAATFIAAVAAAAVSAALSVLSYAFVTRLYVALSGRDLADASGDARPAT